MMSYGYDPQLSEGALKSPIFQTSTFVFKSAEAGKAFFELAYGLRDKKKDEELGLIYSRLNNPDLEILEDRLRLWDRAPAAAAFESGMAAITTTILAARATRRARKRRAWFAPPVATPAPRRSARRRRPATSSFSRCRGRQWKPSPRTSVRWMARS